MSGALDGLHGSLPMLLLGMVTGGAIGALYFGWLWWTVRQLAGRGRSGAWFALQALARYVFALAAFGLIVRGLGWQATAAALAGFVAARMLLQRRLSRVAAAPAPQEPA